MSTKDPAARVARYRKDYAERPWLRDTDSMLDAYKAGVGACTENAFDALLAGDTAEAQVWATLGEIVSFRYRRSF